MEKDMQCITCDHQRVCNLLADYERVHEKILALDEKNKTCFSISLRCDWYKKTIGMCGDWRAIIDGDEHIPNR